jgi:hypothetical protein
VTLPGPTYIKKCPECSELIRQESFSSGNTCRATVWSDGRVDAPMMPCSPWLSLCPHCTAPLWVPDIEKVDMIPWNCFPVTPDQIVPNKRTYDHECYPSAKLGLWPSFNDYLTELRVGTHDTKRETYLRRQAWWAGNNPRRGSDNPEPLSDQERANLQSFARFIPTGGGYGRILRAELRRELGDFNAALRLLDAPVDDELTPHAEAIREQCLLDNPFVIVLPQEDRGSIILG